MSLPAPVVQTKAQLLARAAGGQPEQLMLRDFIETVVPGVLESSGNGWVDDEAALNAAVKPNTIIELAPFARYRLSQSWLFREKSNIIVEGNGATLFFPKENFNNPVWGFLDQRNAAGIQIIGQRVSPWTLYSHITLRNLTLEFEALDDGRRCDGIVVQYVDDVLLENVEVFGLSMGSCIRVNSSKRFKVVRPYLHDCFTDYDGYVVAGDFNMNGIGVDADRTIVSGTPRDSTVEFSHFRIERLEVGAAFEAAYGYQTDGINGGVLAEGTIGPGTITDIGEAIDWFGLKTKFIGIEVSNSAYFGLALKHSSEEINIDACRVENTGLSGIYLAPGADNVEGVVISDTRVKGIVTTGGSFTHACLRLGVDNVGMKTQDVIVTGCQFDPDGGGDYAVLVEGTGSDIFILNNTERAGGSGTFEDLNDTVRSHAPADFVLRGTRSWDPGSIADGAAESTTVTVAGADLGDLAIVGYDNDIQGLIATAFVSAANTVTIRLQNETGAPIDLADSAVRVLVFHT